VRLHAWVSRLAPDRPRPVLFMMDSYARSGKGDGVTGPSDGSCPTALPDDYVPQWLPQATIDQFTLVQVSKRGTGASEGAYDMVGPRTQKDIHEAIAWAAAQRWSTGPVSVVGESGTGFFTYHAIQDPHVRAAVVYTSCADMYRCFYRGGGYNGLADVYLGVTNADWLNPNIFGARMRLGTNANPSPLEQEAAFGQLLAQVKADGVDDAWWRERSALDGLARVKIPVLYTTDLYDIVQPYDALQLTPNARLVLGMGHASGDTVTNGGARYLQAVRRPVDRFLRHYGLGEDNGAERDPRVTLETNTGSVAQFKAAKVLVRGESSWPLAGTRWTRLYLGEGGTLSDRAPKADSASDAGALLSAPHGDQRTLNWTGTAPTDLTNEERLGLTYTTPALKKPLEVSGPLSLRLYGSTLAPDFDWSVRIADVWPDGTSQWITDGYLRATLRRVDAKRSLRSPGGTIVRPWLTFSSPEPVPSGEAVLYRLDVIATSNVFAAGHRLRLDILPVAESEADAPRTGGAGQLTVLRDAKHPSSLLLPVIGARCQHGTPLSESTPALRCAGSYADALR
jgi:uncharacterized protein